MGRIVAALMVVGVGVIALACADFEAPAIATDGDAESGTTASMPTTSASTTGVPETTSGPDDTSTTGDTTTHDPTTATTDTPNTTGGCMPGVFGESRFGEACFQ